ncbi:hypothetical protein O1Q96_37330 [Streptomyces sp. Qhu-G9]|uniref:hypothetical protein n=1 Tax=Streptomyces sp. Qhu-G9 TaxID=3452799 RepID=UPI0022AC3C80|nr:hypothetical protein [Streptomyces aurantiacus]WAU84862.1 hypothetical protein O1Q96_37330 [Streptomyces aurantiacus]
MVATEQQSTLPAAAFVGACALVFTVASFWWLNARQGRLKSWEPLTFAGAVTVSQSRIRFPVVFYNTGAKPIVVRDLRISFRDDDLVSTTPLPWTSSRSHLRPEEDDGVKLPAAFAVPGRSAEQLFIEFGTSKPRYFVPEARPCQVAIEALLGHKEGWRELVVFTWHADRLVNPSAYIAYRNLAEAVEGDGSDVAVAALDAVAASVIAKGGTPDGRKRKDP